jgi:hypothetical protein
MKTGNQKHVARSILFIALLLLQLFALSRGFAPKNKGKYEGMQDPVANGILSEPAGTIDVLVLGDSESYTSVIPMKLWKEHGIASYICGTPGQKLYYTQDFLKKGFQNQSPKIVLLETNAIFRKFSFYSEFARKLGRTIPIFEYHNRWKYMGKYRPSSPTAYTGTTQAKGYEYSLVTASADASNYMKESSKRAAIPERNIGYLEEMKRFCDEKGAKLVFYSSPSTINWNMARHNAISTLAEKMGVTYLDLNRMQKEIPINWKTDTRDKGDHLNYLGAEKVTSYLGNWLANEGGVPNRTQENRYAIWNRDAQNFYRSVT